MPEFTHLHVHTQYSLLDGASDIDKLIKKAKQDGMPAMAISDHGNMFGVPKFVFSAKKQGIKPIIGCEFYITPKSLDDRSDKTRFHQLLLAKNEIGYKNISKLCSLGFTEGMYYKPRVDRETIQKFSDGLIATTCCLAGEVPRTILQKGEEEAEKVFLEWLKIFGEDYYIELQRHGIPDQDKVNEVLIRWAEKHNVKTIATNDIHYNEEKDSVAQDILLCLQTGKDFDDPNRMRFENNQFYMKNTQEMEELFRDVPESIENTQEIVSKIEMPDLKRDILLPVFQLPEGFTSEAEYLKHLTYQGAKRKYKEISSEISQRIDLELGIISQMGFDGYFLITQDFIKEAKNLNVRVGPGRGSAAGSVVAYCTDITDVDPIKYNLLFERFLNPERVSMPDIDIDFDDAGREKVIQFVIDKYGKDKVAQIVTYGTMAAKSAIRDVARVLKLPLQMADNIAKQIPDKYDMKSSLVKLPEFREFMKDKDPLISKTIQMADTLKGSVRHTGIHAAGLIIAPDTLTEYVPVFTSKDSELLITQYDKDYVETVGMLKLDFLGLKTLTIIEDSLENIKNSTGGDVIVDIDNIPLDDEKTYELYQKADTVGTFQFESDGMRAYLKQLKPNNIEDLIAMNALYRPGPMDYIPEFIKRKHGKSKVEFPHPLLEELLKPTYGIMVYQEQIMQTAQTIANFSLGKADILRRAMGKKKLDEMERLETDFIKGAAENDIDEVKAREIFGVMEQFANYGFNRSHAAAYSLVAYQTAYLKANFKPQFMAAVLANNMNDIKKVNYFIDECSKMGIKVLGPDVNESKYYFSVNEKAEIRFGMGAVKGVGEAAVKEIVRERGENGPYLDIFDLTSRVNLRAVNKKCLESLAYSGGMDCFENVHRNQYFHITENEKVNIIEKAVKYGQQLKVSQTSHQQSLFGDNEADSIKKPDYPECLEMNKLDQLKMEKELIGFYISGHPLDDYKLELKSFCNCRITDIERFIGKQVNIGGIITGSVKKKDKRGNDYGIFILEDYSGQVELRLFTENYQKNKHLLDEGQFVLVKGIVQNKFHSETEYELRVNEIKLLAELRDKLAQSITVKFPLEKLNRDFIDHLEKLVNESPGNCRLKFYVYDVSNKLELKLISMSSKVDISNEFINSIESIDDVSIEIN